jgi:hypothetical protein
VDEPAEHADDGEKGEDLETAPYGEEDAGKHVNGGQQRSTEVNRGQRTGESEDWVVG